MAIDKTGQLFRSAPSSPALWSSGATCQGGKQSQDPIGSHLDWCPSQIQWGRSKRRRRAERPGRLAAAQITCLVFASVIVYAIRAIVIVCAARGLFFCFPRSHAHARRKFKVCGLQMRLFRARTSRRSRRSGQRTPQTATNWPRIAHLWRRTRARGVSHFAGASPGI